MPILIKANLTCNFKCDYCYQHPIRQEEMEYDLAAVEATVREQYAEQLKSMEKYNEKLKKEGKPPNRPTVTLHGGEPLVLPIEDIEHFLKLGYELSGKSGIQTNGYNITVDILKMFVKYKTGVGFSIDGPFPLNELRGSGSKANRKKQTRRVLKNLERVLNTEVPTKDPDKKKYLKASVICVLHKKNALGDRREILKHWIKELADKGVQGRINPCCTGNPEIDLTPEEATEAYLDLYNFMSEEGIPYWSPFKDIINNFKGERQVVCVFRTCDPFCTSSATSVLRDGSLGVCLRLYGDGKEYLRLDKSTNMRNNVLRQTDCKDCEWWTYCYGGCTGLSIDWDWRNKDRYCEMYRVLYERIRNNLKMHGIKLAPKRPEKTSKEPDRRTGERSGGDHWDGIIHVDGPNEHHDSNVGVERK